METKACYCCGGSGQVNKSLPFWPGLKSRETQDCSCCHGKGEVVYRTLQETLSYLANTTVTGD